MEEKKINGLVAVRLFLVGALLLGTFGAESAELIVNGDFESGDTGFTSDYSFRADIDMQGTYSVVDDTLDCHSSAASYGDHTTGAGLMMAANGAASADDVVWSETVNVSQHYNCDFSMWVSSWFYRESEPVAELEVHINGVQLGDAFPAPSVTGEWERFSASWDAGTSTTAEIAIYDNKTNLVANDFALDDISFVHVPDPATIGLSGLVNDTIITGGTGSLGTTVSNTGPTGAVNLDYLLGAAVTAGSASLGAVKPGSGSLAPGAGQASTVAAGSTNVGDNVITFTATDPNATNSPQAIDATLTVLAHVDATFANPAGPGTAAITGGGNTLTIDFGIVQLNGGGGHVDSFFDIFAEITAPGFAAGLDLDLLSGTGDTAALFRLSGPASFSNLVAGGSESYAFSLDTSATGIFAATYTFSLSDEDVPGAGTEVLTLHLSGEVIPEPASAALVAAGITGLFLRRRCRG